MIEIKNLTKKYGELTAVNNLSMTIPKGKIFGFLGPNGAGKTTTIKIMTGLMKPTSGQILIAGYDIDKQNIQAKQCFGYVPDKGYLYEKLTAFEFLQFIVNVFNTDSNMNQYHVIHEYLELFSLLQWKDSLIESFSHGMRQRLLFAAALIHQPLAIIIDEPLAGLDPLGMRLIRTVLTDFAAKGNTVFMSTHSLSEAEKICDLLGIIHKGNLVAMGTFQEIKQKALLPDSPLEEIFLQLTSGSL
ncbi:MAG: ABC transporter [Candidatus Fischerbacteria bacterium RBG_13_37_8]|uniref:ABC transporter n=1 Tax=Candidatus Fischerbacteria bacterium RBG_13_37_8 TaxID=1817863 RepID=A0A1F5VG29_9BACT|nr:MAG: ABC transporter [Candidatus Fischerbacteria bacterium RBG_13_37_8]